VLHIVKEGKWHKFDMGMAASQFFWLETLHVYFSSHLKSTIDCCYPLTTRSVLSMHFALEDMYAQKGIGLMCPFFLFPPLPTCSTNADHNGASHASSEQSEILFYCILMPIC